MTAPTGLCHKIAQIALDFPRQKSVHDLDSGWSRPIVSPDFDSGLCLVTALDWPVPEVTEAIMSKSSKPKTSKSKTANADVRRATASRSIKTTTSDASSKSDQILGLLRRKQGASLDEIQGVSGWQAHSVRGFLAGTVKKRLGLKLSSNKSDGTRHYFVAQS